MNVKAEESLASDASSTVGGSKELAVVGAVGGGVLGFVVVVVVNGSMGGVAWRDIDRVVGPDRRAMTSSSGDINR